MKRADLSCDYVRRLFLFEAELGLLIWQERPVGDFKNSAKRCAEWICANWNAKYAGKIAGVMRGDGYRKVAVDDVRYFSHRLIWLFVYGVWPENEIDHVDGTGCGDVIWNIRDATSLENSQNSRLKRNNISGFHGVFWNKSKNKWSADIRVSGKRIYLGYFVEKSDAISARKAAEIQHGFHKNHGRN